MATRVALFPSNPGALLGPFPYVAHRSGPVLRSAVTVRACRKSVGPDRSARAGIARRYGPRHLIVVLVMRRS